MRQPASTCRSPSIDTGMGLERIAAVLQGVHRQLRHRYVFRALIAASEDRTAPQASTATDATRASHRIIADHLRAACFLVADGVLPANEGRGYVLRRIMRRAMRHAHLLGSARAADAPPRPRAHRRDGGGISPNSSAPSR